MNHLSFQICHNEKRLQKTEYHRRTVYEKRLKRKQLERSSDWDSSECEGVSIGVRGIPLPPLSEELRSDFESNFRSSSAKGKTHT